MLSNRFSDNPGCGDQGRDHGLCLDRRHQAISGCAVVGVVRGPGPIGASERVDLHQWPHHKTGVTAVAIGVGAGGARVAVAVQEGRVRAPARDCRARARGARTAKDRNRGSGATSSANLLLHLARRDDVRSLSLVVESRGGSQGRLSGERRDIACGQEAVAWEAEVSQAANFLSTSSMLDNVSSRIDWPTHLPEWQHVPGSASSLEHEWKDGDPWRRDIGGTQVRRTAANPFADGSVCLLWLPAIMEGNMIDQS